MSEVEWGTLAAVLLINIPFNARFVTGGKDLRPVLFALTKWLELLLLAALGEDHILGVYRWAAALVLADVGRRVGTADQHPGQVQFRTEFFGLGGLHQNVELAAVVAGKLLEFEIMVVVGKSGAGRSEVGPKILATVRHLEPAFPSGFPAA